MGAVTPFFAPFFHLFFLSPHFPFFILIIFWGDRHGHQHSDEKCNYGRGWNTCQTWVVQENKAAIAIYLSFPQKRGGGLPPPQNWRHCSVVESTHNLLLTWSASQRPKVKPRTKQLATQNATTELTSLPFPALSIHWSVKCCRKN